MSTPMVKMTREQLQQLIESVRLNATAGAVEGAPIEVKSKGTFSNCTASFGGDYNYELVEYFITTIITYKELESISDEEALGGISLLFRNTASTWWQGVKDEAKTWTDAIALICEHFAPPKTAYQVYMEIFENPQDEENYIHTFVCQKRALLAQLPEGRHDEETELDLIYGLLHIKYREHIPRYAITSFRELLEKGRYIDLNILEEETDKLLGARKTKCCSYCNCRGHMQDECRKRINEEHA